MAFGVSWCGESFVVHEADAAAADQSMWFLVTVQSIRGPSERRIRTETSSYSLPKLLCFRQPRPQHQ